MDRVELRELSYFVAVAEELHFGRAAERLGIAQPPLSRAIIKLEQHLGVTLLTRTSRSVALTAAGETLLHEARKALDAAAAAVRRACRAGEVKPRLPVAMKPGGDSGLLPRILATYRGEEAAVPVEILVCGVGEQASWLREGKADAAFLHLPYDDASGFDTEPLVEEPQVVVLPREHALAGNSALSVEDLRDEPAPRWPGMPADRTTGPLVRDSGQLMQLIALGQAVAVLPASVSAHLHPDLVAVPVPDAPHTTTVMAWPERSRSLAVAAFVRAAARAGKERAVGGPTAPTWPSEATVGGPTGAVSREAARYASASPSAASSVE
ncbi:MAG: LysR family transcriptional regulator [Candidatus Dormibacteraceae bacterium]